jgi:hypothetical protein
MTIAATRMHRSLVDFASRPPDTYEILHLLSRSCSCSQCFRTHENVRTRGFVFSKIKRTHAASILFNRRELSVEAVDELHPTPQMNCQSQGVNTDDGVHERPNDLRLYDNVECDV